MADVELFLQGLGVSRIALIKVPSDGKVGDIIESARANGFPVPSDQKVFVTIENSDEPLAVEENLVAAGIGPRSRVHLHTCRQIEVTVHFGHRTQAHSFAASTTVKAVKEWADNKFELKGVDATEHVLQLCNSDIRPAADTQLGALVQQAPCALCFDLVPKQRVEG